MREVIKYLYQIHENGYDILMVVQCLAPIRYLSQQNGLTPHARTESNEERAEHILTLST